MSRLRRLDRAILSEGADTPLDSEDQELLIAQLVEQNDALLRLFTKTLVGSILVEIPISVLALRFSSEGARPVVLLLLTYKLYTSQGLKLIDLLLLLPLINMVAVTLIRHWYSSVAYEISGLHDLKYKFKTA
ncbi:hypothetical protein HF325_000351 [Metschnikowia pulcherrima]|uniref:Uncharacterized protein n=1 Tax=Metschnikowia pulcherrima TaxID=27326 RepID=A0A8H7GYF5_9ASCO|nr:hypothetical protein HF325_000351 [Metschnikowia pulcherrima]